MPFRGGPPWRVSGTGPETRVLAYVLFSVNPVRQLKVWYEVSSLQRSLLLGYYQCFQLAVTPHTVVLSSSRARTLCCSVSLEHNLSASTGAHIMWNICALDFHIIVLTIEVTLDIKAMYLTWIHMNIMYPSRCGCAWKKLRPVQAVVGCRSYQVGFAVLSAGTSGR